MSYADYQELFSYFEQLDTEFQRLKSALEILSNRFKVAQIVNNKTADRFRDITPIIWQNRRAIQRLEAHQRHLSKYSAINRLRISKNAKKNV